MKIYFSIAAFGLLSCIYSCDSVDEKHIPGTSKKTLALDMKWAQSFIDSSNLKISEQFKAGDSVALASHYWPDAEMLFSNSEPIKGNEILAAWGSMTRMGIQDFTFSTTDIKGDSEFIIETGKYEMKDAKGSLVDRGKYVVVWQQRDGQWKLYRDIGNTSLPAPG